MRYQIAFANSISFDIEAVQPRFRTNFEAPIGEALPGEPVLNEFATEHNLHSNGYLKPDQIDVQSFLMHFATHQGPFSHTNVCHRELHFIKGSAEWRKPLDLAASAKTRRNSDKENQRKRKCTGCQNQRFSEYVKTQCMFAIPS